MLALAVCRQCCQGDTSPVPCRLMQCACICHLTDLVVTCDCVLQVYGGDAVFETPYGNKAMVYADYAASGRLLKPVEAWLQAEVYPWFANVHSEVRLIGCNSRAA